MLELIPLGNGDSGIGQTPLNENSLEASHTKLHRGSILKKLDGILLIKYVAVKRQSPKNVTGRLDWKIKALYASTSVLYFLSTISLYCGV